LIGAFGLRDNLRATVRSAVKHAKTNGHMKLRMISGDHIETARVTALKAGILEEADDQDRQEYAVMHADVFEQKVGLNEDDKIADM
jgi:P-type E1-E2 ATPase